MRQLLACPFCREMFPEDESANCPHCGVALVRAHQLPLSYEEREARALQLAATPPEERTLPWMFLGRGRGLLGALALLGLVAFFFPWVLLTQPDERAMSGFQLARRLFWLWGGAAAWFTLLPLIVTRRNVRDMRGARLIATLLSAMTAGEVLVLLTTTPATSPVVPVHYEWQPALYLSLATSVLAALVALRFGGSNDDFPADFGKPAALRLPPESSQGETLH